MASRLISWKVSYCDYIAVIKARMGVDLERTGLVMSEMTSEKGRHVGGD
jgi:hypothetical protein